MKYNYLFTIFCLFVFGAIQAQTNCEPIPNFKCDFCYDNALIPQAKAQFEQGVDYFYFKGTSAKKFTKIMLPKSPSLEYLVKLSDDKSLKLNSKDVLFLQEALKNWDKYAVEAMVKKVTETLRTSEDLAKLAIEEKTPSGLGVQILDKGNGKQAEVGKKVKVHYRGYLNNATVFDASFNRGQAFEFPLGQGRVIKGWDEGIAKLKVGDHAILRIPAELGYGPRSTGSIPANSELIFEVILMDVE